MSIIGSAPWLITPPSSPSQWDDEFEADGLDPKWTRVSGAGIGTTLQATFNPYASFSFTTHQESINNDRRGWFMRQPCQGYGSGGYGVTTEGILQDVSGLPTDCMMIIRGTRNNRRSAQVDGDGEIWMVMYQNADPRNAFYMSLDSFPSQVGVVCTRTTAAVPAFTNIGEIANYFGKSYPAEFIAIQKRGNTFDGWVASYTGNWVWLGSYAHAVALDRVLLAFNNASGVSPGNQIVGIDYFRVLSGTKLP